MAHLSRKAKFQMVCGVLVKNVSRFLYAPELEKSLYVCPKCDYHLRIGARKRLNIFLDDSSYEEIAANLTTKDPLKV